MTPPDHSGSVHPESYCHRCGGPNVVWFAPSPPWNAVMRGGSISGVDEYDGIVCPTCFVVLADERGIASDWRLSADPNVDLELVAPDGRAWDDDADRWVDPVASVEGGAVLMPSINDLAESTRTAALEACKCEFDRGHSDGYEDGVTAAYLIAEKAQRCGNDPVHALACAIAIFEEHKEPAA